MLTAQHFHILIQSYNKIIIYLVCSLTILTPSILLNTINKNINKQFGYLTGAVWCYWNNSIET